MSITLMDTAAYFIDMSPSKAIKKKTPIEIWSGHPSDYEMLSFFGCVAYPHDKQGMLEPRVIKYVLLRYLERVKRDGFSKEEQHMRVSRSSSWAKAGELQMDIPALIACKDYKLEQLNVKTTFLHQNLIESPRKWHKRFDEYMLSNGFKHSNYENCVCYRSYALGKYIYLLLYVDDMLIACKSKAEIGSTNYFLKKEFNMKDLGKATKILGMEIVKDQSRKILRFSQSGYVFKNLNNFRIDNEKSVKMPLGGHFKLSLKDCSVRDYVVERMSKVPYANVIGSLMYFTRPDITYAGTAKVGLVYATKRGNHVDVTVQGCVVSWKATLQYVVTLSTIEAEYMAVTEAMNEAIWLRGLLEELGVELNTLAVNYDNQDAIHLSWNHVFHEKTNHINVCYYFIREVLESKTVKVLNVGIGHSVVDALTNVVPGLKLQHFLELLNNMEDVENVLLYVIVSVSVLRSRPNEARMRWPDSSDDQQLLLVIQHGHGAVTQIHVEIRGRKYGPVVNNAQWREVVHHNYNRDRISILLVLV
nr:retrovirus-related Pol polyprotein from transposon TNT 1-94 [Tanacetum cinerariifolium]